MIHKSTAHIMQLNRVDQLMLLMPVLFRNSRFYHINYDLNELKLVHTMHAERWKAIESRNSVISNEEPPYEITSALDSRLHKLSSYETCDVAYFHLPKNLNCFDGFSL